MFENVPGRHDLSLFTVLPLTWHVSRVALQWMFENVLGRQDLSLFDVDALTLHVSRVPILQYIPQRTPVSPFPSYFTVYLALQSGSAVGGRKCPWEAGFVAIYGVRAHFALI